MSVPRYGRRMGDKHRHRTDRTKRRRRDRFEVRVHPARFGPGITTAPLEDVLDALATAPDPSDWSAVSRFVVPIFPRRRPIPFDAPEPVRMRLPPGVLVSFGIDLGPAFAYVMPEVLARWPVTADDLAVVALDNLRELLRSSNPRSLTNVDFDGIPIRVLQTGHGVASTAVLLPEQLSRIFGTAPQRFVAPSRDLLVSFPLASDPEAAADLVDGLADRDPNAPAVESFVLDLAGLRCEALRDGAEVA